MALRLAVLEGTVLAATVWTTLAAGEAAATSALAAAADGGRAMALAACCIVALYYSDLYDLRSVRRFSQFAARLPAACVLALLFTASLYALVPGIRIEGLVLASGLPMLLAVLIAVRVACYELLGGRPFVERVLVLGTTPLALRIVEETLAQPRFRGIVLGLVDDGGTPSEELPLRFHRLGPIERLGTIIRDFAPDHIICAVAERRGRLHMQDLLGPRTRGVRVEDGIKAYERLTGKLAIEALTPSALIFSNDFQKSRASLAFGRLLSFVTATVGLVLTAPLLAVVAVLIKLDSRGPVLFIQKRVGLGGKPFPMVKFRTMNTAIAPSEWVRDNGHRITRIGRWLRRFRLDELPQLLNVVRGDMNLVGPRPHPLSNFALFAREIPYYELRSLVRPGLTGWAQIRHGYANDLVEETEKMRFDLYYIKHLSMRLDLQILLDTVRVVLVGHGAASVGPKEAARIEAPAGGPTRASFQARAELRQAGASRG